MKRPFALGDIVDWRLCVGCGACAYACPDGRVTLWDYASEGIRPAVTPGDCTGCSACVDVCPGLQTDFARNDNQMRPDGRTKEFEWHWGPVLAAWEGHAADPEIRFKGSSGGVLTALSLYCIEKGGFHGVLQTGSDPANPIRNRTRLSRVRSDLLAATGSRYAPASVCNGLALVEAAPAPCVVVGQPSEIAGLAKARALRPALDSKVGLTLSFFCAGSPPTAATVALLISHGINPTCLEELRYRGMGWPGHFAARAKGAAEPAVKLTYQDSWAFLQARRPWAVQMWPDGSGELADISCGDPWYTEPDGANPGSSLVLARTKRGHETILKAMEAGYLELESAEDWKVEKSQAGLWQKKGSVWGRIAVLRALRIPTTRIQYAHLWRCWLALSLGEKLRSTLGTLRRVLKRRLYRPACLSASEAMPVAAAAPFEAIQPRDRPGGAGRRLDALGDGGPLG